MSILVVYIYRQVSPTIYSRQDIVIYIYAMIEAIKSQLESYNFKQSHVNMGTATITMLVSQ